MNFSSMEYFIVLSKELNFTRAAEKLHLTQQSLSAHIAGLEKELGCTLLTRSPKLDLTYGGRIFLQYAQEFHKNYLAMQRQFCDISQNHRGLLRLGAATTRGRTLLPDCIAAFQQQYPNVEISLTEGSNKALIQNLLDGDLDLAIADFPKNMQGITFQDFYKEEIALTLSKKLFSQIYGIGLEQVLQEFQAGHFAELARCPIVLGDEDDIDGRMGLRLLKANHISQPLIRARSHNVGMLLTLCTKGIGACFCPLNLMEHNLSAGEKTALYIFPLGPKASYPIRFGCKETTYSWSIIQLFMECAKKTYRKKEV